MNGFQTATLTIIQGIHSDLTIEAPLSRTGSRGFLNFNTINNVLTKEFSHIISSATPIARHHAIIQKYSPKKGKQHTSVGHDISHVVLIEGISPATELHTRSLLTKISPKSDQEGLLFAPHSVRIGKTLAQELALSEESLQKNDARVNLLFAQTTTPDKTISFDTATVVVQGTFTTGIDDFDQNVIFCSMETFEELFPEIGMSHIGIKLHPSVDPRDAQRQLQQRFNLDIISWQELYPALLDAQKLEQSAMMLILLLVACMASVTGIALLAMYLFHQQTTLAIFLAMGMRIRQLRAIFTLIALMLTLAATTIGLLLATAASWVLETYRLIPLPTVYYVEYVPAHMNGFIIILVLILMNGVSLITSWLTTGRIKNMNRALLLKQNTI